MPDYILQLKNITKTYPGVKALKEVNLDVERGEIHAICGENGAGKSTLIKSCTGAVIPDEGEIVMNGKSYASMTPVLAETEGIAVIYQELNSVNDLTVAENVFLGNEIKRGILVDKEAMNRKTAEIFKQLELEIDPRTMVGDLSVGYKQMVEIAKALSRNAELLIMDEPSAPLTNNEIDKLFVIIDKLKKQGVTIIYISHRMNEIFQLSDRISVMRDGEMIKTLLTKETNIDELITCMVGRAMNATFPKREKTQHDETILKVEHLSGNGLNDISFELKKGELLGLAGLIGAGRTELAQLLFGVKKRTEGKIVWKGKEVNYRNPRDAIKDGIYLVPEDRKEQGCLLPLSIHENITVSSLKTLSSMSVIDKKAAQSLSEEYKKKLEIKAPSLFQAVENLSGGNQQKVVVAKALATTPDLIIFDEPTRGIDIGAKQEIYKICNHLLEEGKTIIMISSEMEELLGMCDRILVIAEGHLSGIIDRELFSQETIMGYASAEY